MASKRETGLVSCLTPCEPVLDCWAPSTAPPSTHSRTPSTQPSAHSKHPTLSTPAPSSTCPGHMLPSVPATHSFLFTLYDEP